MPDLPLNQYHIVSHPCSDPCTLEWGTVYGVSSMNFVDAEDAKYWAEQNGLKEYED